MFKNYRDKIAISGITVLGVGVALLIFTFISAYGFLTQSLQILTSEDLAQTFGLALSPLISTCIRIMYLGVMGWIGSLITIRGVTMTTNAPKLETIVPQKPIASQSGSASLDSAPHQKGNAKPEPEIVVIPPESTCQAKRTRNSSTQQESTD